MTIIIPTGEFTGVVSDALPFAFPDDELPGIHAVRLEWDGEMLHSMATDKHVIGWSSWHPHDDPEIDVQEDLLTDWGSGDEPWAISIPAPDAKHLVTTFKLGKKEAWTPLSVDYDPAQHRVKISRSRDTGHPAVTVVVDGVGHDFPNIRKLLAAGSTIEPVGTITYTATLLALFGKVRQRGSMEMTFSGQNGVSLVSIGERFQGAIMPVRTADERAA